MDKLDKLDKLDVGDIIRLDIICEDISKEYVLEYNGDIGTVTGLVAGSQDEYEIQNGDGVVNTFKRCCLNKIGKLWKNLFCYVCY